MIPDCGERDGSKLIQCSSNTSECVHDYMICDGHKDCDGGEDEDASSCMLRKLVRAFSLCTVFPLIAAGTLISAPLISAEKIKRRVPLSAERDVYALH